ncbi:hypothetical protein GCM10007421_03000 [Halopseudomonas oceani]|uniref:DUF3426 domain-containing protein n=1 Tax=Halopseudomonas oceani TaxID=1708783 RepID=A0A2P4EXT6_9GAMM|nr:DUF3426 domain-containing protein [Halopseudomonas oceani]POB05040.1 DUF3426 domain-containing protein [Halopseudomonas oceani]GGE32611.1 hypothetical protein GCM10007421_03000 [Halopseudomonas oceani]
MSELQVTQCPFCKTHFRLTHEQLHAAGGNVRCGACLKVFNALPQAPAPSKPEQPTPPKRSPVNQDTLLIHDDLELDDLDLEALGLDESILDEINPRPQGSPPPGADTDLDTSDVPTSLAETVSTELFAESGLSALDDEDLDLDESFRAAPAAREFTQAQNAQPQPAPAASEQPEVEPEQPHQPFAPHARLLPLQDDDIDHPLMQRDLRREPSLGTSTTSAEDHEQTDVLEPGFAENIRLPDLEDEPLHFEAPLSRRRARHNWLWGLLCVLALAGLAAQATYYNLEAWSRDDRLRPALENVCLIAGCHLPTRVDISQIRSSNLLVRPHPEFPNTLDINLIIYNRADYDQPFPVIRMAFSDSRGRTVATHDFRPTEYLAGELAGRTLMPSQTPIHIALSMVAPTQQATSYQLDFVAP